MQTEPKNYYDIQNSILKKGFIPTEDQIKTLNSFMMCRWLSNHPYGVEIANYINSHTDIPVEAQYWLARSMVNGVKYIGFPKKEKEDMDTLDIISKEYKCNIELSKRYLKILPEDVLAGIITKWTKHGRTK